MSMGGYNNECANCGRYIHLDEHFEEERNEYGYPVTICDQCANTNSSTLGCGGRLPNCS